KHVLEIPGHGGLEPAIDHIHAKAALFALENFARQKCTGDAAMEPFATAVADLEAGSESLHILHHLSVEIGHAYLEAVRHGQLVGVHEELVGKRCTQLE